MLRWSDEAKFRAFPARPAMLQLHWPGDCKWTYMTLRDNSDKDPERISVCARNMDMIHVQTAV
jgi:hypothetical protein